MSDAPHDQLGTWTMDGETEKTRTPIKALREKYGDKVKIHFVKGLEYSRDKNKTNFNKVLEKAYQADAIIAFVGEEAILSGEAHCLADIKLQGAQSELIKVLSGTNKPLITVIMAGRPLVINEELNLSDAVLYAWHPGTMGGNALADILFGKTTPGGNYPLLSQKQRDKFPSTIITPTADVRPQEKKSLWTKYL